MDPEELDKQLARAARDLAAVWLSLSSALRDQFTVTELAEMISVGRTEQVLQAIPPAMSRIVQPWNEAFTRAGAAAARGTVELNYSIVNDLAVREMQANNLRMVNALTRQQTEATRQALSNGIVRGANPIEQARSFRDSIGLTPRQVRSVDNYRRLLENGDREALTRALRDRRFDRSILSGKPLSRSKIDIMTERYRQRFIKYRSEVIARTESLRAVHAGQHNAFQQAIADGLIQPEQVQRTWITARDERVRSSHTTMNDQVQTGGEPFISGRGNLLQYPGDPAAPGSETIQCRCRMTEQIAADSGAPFTAEIIEL